MFLCNQISISLFAIKSSSDCDHILPIKLLLLNVPMCENKVYDFQWNVRVHSSLKKQIPPFAECGKFI